MGQLIDRSIDATGDERRLLLGEGGKNSMRFCNLSYLVEYLFFSLWRERASRVSPSRNVT